MAWSVEKQEKYEKLVEESHRYGREQVEKTLSDAGIKTNSCLTYWNIQDDLAQAYRAGAIDAIFVAKFE